LFNQMTLCMTRNWSALNRAARSRRYRGYSAAYSLSVRFWGGSSTQAVAHSAHRTYFRWAAGGGKRTDR